MARKIREADTIDDPSRVERLRSRDRTDNLGIEVQGRPASADDDEIMLL